MADLDELDAMKAIATALEPLEEAARLRALQWALSRYRSRGGSGDADPTLGFSAAFPQSAQGNTPSFQTFAELFEAAGPSIERDKALIAAYWTQICQHADSFGAQTLNDELKNLGHRVGNITDALTQLKDERPALVLQLKKSGTSKQARKTYKLSLEGIKRAQSMIRHESE